MSKVQTRQHHDATLSDANGFTVLNAVQIYVDDWDTSPTDRAMVRFFPDYEGELTEVTMDDGSLAVNLGLLTGIRVRFAESRYYTAAKQWHRFLAEFPDHAPNYVRIASASNHFNAGIIDLTVNPLSWRFKEDQVAETLVWLAGSFFPSIRNH